MEPQDKKCMDYPMHPWVEVKDFLWALVDNTSDNKCRRVSTPLDEQADRNWTSAPWGNPDVSYLLWGLGLGVLWLIWLSQLSSARRVDEQVAEEVESSLRTGIMKNKQSNLFHQQNRANQRLLSTARKTRKETVLQDSLSSVQSRVNDEKAARQQSLLRQRKFAASLKTLNDGSGNSHMSLALFEEGSQLQKKIDYEKNLRRRSTITQTSLMAELSELSASPSGKPNTSVTNRLPKARVVSENIEASSSGRVSAALVRALSDAPAPGPGLSPPFFQDNNVLLSFMHKQSCPGGSTRRQLWRGGI